MKHIRLILLFLLLVSYSFCSEKMGTCPKGINYLEPVPGANLVKPENNIIIGYENQIGLSEADILNSIEVSGTKSGQFYGTVILSSDNKKIIFKPSVPFKLGESINVKITGKLLRTVSSGTKEYDYMFNIIARKPQPSGTNFQQLLAQNNLNYDFVSAQNFSRKSGPADVPQLIITTDTNPSNGYLFIAPYSVATYLTIADNHGVPYWFTQVGFGGDFKKQPNGNLTYFDGVQLKHFELDQNYNIIDTFYCGNGYVTDIHELRVLGNGHAYVMAYDTEVVNMSPLVPGGDTAAQVVGFIVQEIDQNKNVIFQWRSWDNFAITDAWHENLLAHNIDAVHGNAIEIDNDSNIIISSRHLDEITKINRITGDIIWRFGGKHNQFTFVGDTLKFTYQHAIRRLANGNLTLYDNGNWHTPHYSRAVEYSLDTANMTAHRVWQFRHSPDVFGSWGGYVQRLNNGNTLIAWGGTSPTVTEVDPNGRIVLEGSYPIGVYTYRAYKFDWSGLPTAINNQSGPIPKSYKLDQNYPNPFNPATIITFDLPKAGTISLKVYDVMGREAGEVLNNVHLNAGGYKYTFDGSHLSSGVYFYRLIDGGKVIGAKKMILIK